MPTYALIVYLRNDGYWTCESYKGSYGIFILSKDAVNCALDVMRTIPSLHAYVLDSKNNLKYIITKAKGKAGSQLFQDGVP